MSIKSKYLCENIELVTLPGIASAGCVNNDSEESKSDTFGIATTSKGKATGAKSKDRVPLTQALLIDYIELLQGRKEVKYTSAPLTVSVNEAQKTAETLKAGDQVWSLNLIRFCWLYNQRLALKNGFFDKQTF